MFIINTHKELEFIHSYVTTGWASFTGWLLPFPINWVMFPVFDSDAATIDETTLSTANGKQTSVQKHVIIVFAGSKFASGSESCHTALLCYDFPTKQSRHIGWNKQCVFSVTSTPGQYCQHGCVYCGQIIWLCLSFLKATTRNIYKALKCHISQTINIDWHIFPYNLLRDFGAGLWRVPQRILMTNLSVKINCSI